MKKGSYDPTVGVTNMLEGEILRVIVLLWAPAVPAFARNSEKAALGIGNTQYHGLESALPPIVGFGEAPPRATFKYICAHDLSPPNNIQPLECLLPRTLSISRFHLSSENNAK